MVHQPSIRVIIKESEIQMRDTEEKLKLIGKLNIMDDIFFHKVAEDVGACEEIICTILNDPDIRIMEVRTQDFLRNTDAKSVILDALCRDENGRLFNVEMQKADDDDHQRRVRYNSSNIDTYYTEKGLKYMDVPDIFIIFITKRDFFHQHHTIYHIDRIIRETGKAVSNGCYEIYVNAEIDDGSLIAELMQYIKHTNGKNEKFLRLSDRVSYFKEQKEGVTDMCELIETYAEKRAKESLEQGLEQGIEHATEKIVRRMLSEQEALERIVLYTGCPLEDVKRIKTQMENGI